MVSRNAGMTLVLVAMLVSACFSECGCVRRNLRQRRDQAGRPPGIHDVTSPDMQWLSDDGQRERVIDVNFAPGALETPLAAVHDWISRSACAVTTYYGRFPVKTSGLANRAGWDGGTERRFERKNHGLWWRLYKGLRGPTRDRRRPQARLGHDP